MEAQINYMWDEYEITLSSAAALKKEGLQDLTGMKKEIASLKEQIPAGTYGRQLPSVEHEEPPQRVMPYEKQAPCHVTEKRFY